MTLIRLKSDALDQNDINKVWFSNLYKTISYKQFQAQGIFVIMLQEFMKTVLEIRRCNLVTGISALDSRLGSGQTSLPQSPQAGWSELLTQPRNGQSQAPMQSSQGRRDTSLDAFGVKSLA